MSSSKILASPLPPPPGGDPFTALQWTTFLAIADTVIASVRPATGPSNLNERCVPEQEYQNAIGDYRRSVTDGVDDAVLERFLGEKLTDVDVFQPLLRRIFLEYIKPDAVRGIAIFLDLLNTRPGSLLLTGYAAPFQQHLVSTRELVLLGWRVSVLPPLRKIYKSFSTISKTVWLKVSLNAQHVMGFPRTPDLGPPGAGYKFEFLKFPVGDTLAEIETDVVIVGSGCGGGVAAKNIAEAGHRVVVIEKAYYQSPAQLPMAELNAGIHMFENGQLLPSDDGSISVVAGSTWGGGGSVNWSASLQTQGFVRKEWADGGLKFFESGEFQNCLDGVCERMGVSTSHLEHNHGNRMLLEGARRLGYHAYTVPQNTGGKKHHDGYCSLGCRSCEKQGPINSWLPDAARVGAKMIEGLKIEEIIFEYQEGVKVAVGVKGRWTSRDANGGLEGKERIVRDVIVRAKRVVLSAGTLWSPILLQKSGVKNSSVGRNLHLHPATCVFGVYPEEVCPWEGPILTTVCTEFENLDGRGHGAKFECLAMTPSMALTNLPWHSSLAYKTTIIKYKHMNGFVALVRDRDSGVVYPDPVTGTPRITYTVSEFDRGHAWEGACELAKVVFKSGAREVHLGTDGVEPFVRPGDGEDDEEAFRTWLSALHNKSPHPRYSLSFATAHQMGTCRMGTSPRNSVVDPCGKVWGVEGVYVCDASVFPSASGVNPMVTNMAIAQWISRGIVREMAGGE
ncbi:MAG: hypothetical protein M1840_007931 [Geoglossum simile]|nr:MAG: hypothetical protein M1840_007931 [Geoglossum simile]